MHNPIAPQMGIPLVTIKAMPLQLEMSQTIRKHKLYLGKMFLVMNRQMD
jgi:hypothetical protein